MKKLIVAIIAIAVIVPLCVFLAFSSANSGVEGSSVPTDILAGDVNGDGKISVIDSISLMLYLAGKPVEIVNDAADVNGDGVVDKKDCGNIIVNAVNNIQESANTDKCEHSLIKEIEAVPATCTESGTAEGWKCTKCNKLFKDQTANIIVTAAKLTIPASHKVVTTPAVAPTCAATGLTEGKHCEVCNTIFVPQEKLNTLEHSFNEWQVEFQATKSTDGKKSRKCNNCSNTESIILYATGSLGLEYKLDETTNTYSVIGIGTCTDTDIVVPGYYKDLPVKAIGYECFAGCQNIISVTLLEGIETIGEFAFGWCTSLTDITIPKTIIAIDSGAFDFSYSGSSLTNVYISDLGAWCSIDFHDPGSNPLQWAPNFYLNEVPLVNLVIPQGAEVIEDYAFCGYKSLKSVTISDSVTRVGEWSFMGCINLERVEMNNGVTKLGPAAFMSCENLKEIALSNNLEIIEFGTFSDCSILDNVVIPAGIRIIERQAFSRCSKLTELALHNGIEKVEVDAFWQTNIKELFIPASLTSIENSAFESSTIEIIEVDINNPIYHSTGNCLIETNTSTLILGCRNSIIPADGSVTIIGAHAFSNCAELKKIDIPDPIHTIQVGAFWGCDSLCEISFGKGLNTIEEYLFNPFGLYTNNLTTITVKEGNKKYHSSGNCLIETSAKKLVLGANTSIIPSDKSVISIGDYAFAYCQNLTTITIPDSVVSIDNYAFAYCGSLTDITISNNVTTINDHAFTGCMRLQNIILPDSLTHIGIEAFANCGLVSVTIPKSISEISDGLFAWNPLQTVILLDGIISIGDNAFSHCNFTSIKIPDGVTSIGIGAFDSCSNLANITIPSSVANIGDSAFAFCSSLTSISLHNNIEKIGSRVFWGCYNLNNINIPNSVTIIGYGAFDSCSRLTSIKLPNGITSIGDFAFIGCSALENFVYEGTIEQWEQVSKGFNWKDYYSSFTVVHCTDGDYEIERPNYDDTYYPGFGPIIN